MPVSTETLLPVLANRSVAMNTSLPLFVTLAVLLVAFAGCSFFSSDGGTSFASLEDTQWTLEKIVEAGQELELPADQDYQLYFRKEGKLGARVDCNSVSGTYSFDEKGDIEIRFLLSTYIGCGPNSLHLEFGERIHDTDSYGLIEEENRLVLRQSSNRSLVFVALEGEPKG